MNLHRIGRKNSILIGYTCCASATLGFGLISLIPRGDTTKRNEYNDSQSKLFFAVSICIRFLQGVGDSMVATAGKPKILLINIAYSIVSIEFPHAREKHIGYC
jgi:MFS family permease